MFRDPAKCLLVGLGVLAGACSIDASYDGTQYTCPDQRCPDGFSCVNGRCVVPGDGGAPDAGASGLDATVADALVAPDADDCMCSPVTFADSCVGVEVLDMAGQAGGQLVCASTDANGNDLLGCTGSPMPGKDAAFRVAANAGQTIRATLRPDGFDGVVYVMTDCSSQCLAIENSAGVGGTEILTYVVATSTDHFVVVDSPSSAGCYELTVEVTGP